MYQLVRGPFSSTITKWMILGKNLALRALSLNFVENILGDGLIRLKRKRGSLVSCVGLSVRRRENRISGSRPDKHSHYNFRLFFNWVKIYLLQRLSWNYWKSRKWNFYCWHQKWLKTRSSGDECKHQDSIIHLKSTGHLEQ